MDALIKTLDYLTKTNVFVVDLLQKGLTENKIKQILKTKGLKVRDEIKELYQTVNGTSVSDTYLGLQYFFPGNIMLSLEKAIELYDEECIEYASWEEGYLPIFWNGNRDYLLVDCLNKKCGVYFYSPDEFRFDGIVKKYDTMELLFATVLQCFEVKAYQLGRTLEDIKYDGELVIAISKQMNPESVYWDFKPPLSLDC